MAKKKSSTRKNVSVVNPDPVFLSVYPKAYRGGKIGLLKAQMKLLECSKTIEKLRGLQKDTQALRRELYALLEEAIKLQRSLYKSMPDLNQYTRVEKLDKVLEISVNYREGDSSIGFSKKVVPKGDELDLELQEIQEKLAMLNMHS